MVTFILALHCQHVSLQQQETHLIVFASISTLHFLLNSFLILPSANFWGFLALLSLIALGVRLGCLFEMFLAF